MAARSIKQLHPVEEMTMRNCRKTTMTDILLIQPPIRDFYLTAKRTIPYGLASMAAALQADGFSVTIFDALATAKARVRDWPEEMAYLRPYYGCADRSPVALFQKYRHFGYSFDHIGRQAQKSGAFLVGISALFTPYIAEALRTAEKVKVFHPDCKIVLGGHHPTAFSEEVLQHPAVDYVIRGEGEQALPALARALKGGGTKMETVPGIGFKRPDGTLHISTPAQVQNLDRLVPPATGLVNQDYYRRNGRGSAVIVSSRGCPLKCSYCCVGGASHLRYRRRSLKSVMQEIETEVVKMKAGFIDFEDEALAWDRDWFLELLLAIRKRFKDNGPELRAMNGLYPPSLDEVVVRQMRAAGFKALNLSLGTSSLPQLKRFNRPDVRKAFGQALELAETHGLNPVGYIIAGAPFQRAETTLEDLLFLAQRRVLVGISIFYPAPESKDYRLCAAEGLLPQTYALMRASVLPLSHTTTRTEAVTLLRLGRVVNFMKLLVGRGEALPNPQKPPAAVSQRIERVALGREVVGWFLYDGKIRGVDLDGRIYEHQTAAHLTTTFRERLKQIEVVPAS